MKDRHIIVLFNTSAHRHSFLKGRCRNNSFLSNWAGMRAGTIHDEFTGTGHKPGRVRTILFKALPAKSSRCKASGAANQSHGQWCSLYLGSSERGATWSPLSNERYFTSQHLLVLSFCVKPPRNRAAAAKAKPVTVALVGGKRVFTARLARRNRTLNYKCVFDFLVTLDSQSIYSLNDATNMRTVVYIRTNVTEGDPYSCAWEDPDTRKWFQRKT